MTATGRVVLKLRCGVLVADKPCGAAVGTVTRVKDYSTTVGVATKEAPQGIVEQVDLDSGLVATVTGYPRSQRPESWTMETPLTTADTKVYAYCKEHGAVRGVTRSEITSAIARRQDRLLVTPDVSR